MPDYSTVRLGRNRRDVLDLRDLKFADYADLTVIAHPGTVDNTSALPSWPMWLNDRLGCCTISSSAGQTCAACAHAGGCTIPDNAVETAYSAVSGYDPNQVQPDGSNPTDNGAVMIDVLKYRRATGILDAAGHPHKVWAYLSIPHTHTRAVNAGIFLADGLYVGWSLPRATQGLGTEWRLPAGQALAGDWEAGSWGGHATVVLGYDETTGDRKIISWGEVITIGATFWDAYVEEVWAVVLPDWVAPAGIAPNGFNAVQLDADLKAIGGRLPAHAVAASSVVWWNRWWQDVEGFFARHFWATAY